ncbi:MAG TPA: NUDIX hydrolase [Burkholderiales bacterium]|nr:NUDIX hydrolase [Burkholderiales bacterium]
MAEHDRDYSETMVSSRTVYSGVLLNVVADEVRLPNGRTAVREYIHHPGACMMLAFVDEQTILFERQFRYPMRRHFIEVPAGKIEPGEDPLVTAQRELKEECGYEAAEWRHLATLHPCIGYADEHIELYLARGLTHVGGELDDEEFLDVFPLTIREALAWVRDGRITEAKAITALLWADRIARGEWT